MTQTSEYRLRITNIYFMEAEVIYLEKGGNFPVLVNLYHAMI